MLDPLTALGAVANIAQFIEFAIKISSKSRDIYHSASGNPIELEDLRNVNDDLSKISAKLRDSFTSATTSTCLTEDEQALHELCKSCIDVSEGLTGALSKILHDGKCGRFRSFRRALKSVWSKEEIDQLERRIRLYKEELNLRIFESLLDFDEHRSTIDFQAVQQTEGFALLAEEAKTTIQSLMCITAEVHDGFERQEAVIADLHLRTETVIIAQGEESRDEHLELTSHVTSLAQQTSNQSQHQLDAQAITKMAVDLSLERNLAEHERTRNEMKRLKEQAETQVEVLTEEIRQLKIELEASVKTIVASIGTASTREAERLKEISNAKFNLWVAKELILEKLKAFIALFRFNFAAEMWTSNTAEIRSWKLMPYPKFTSPSTETNLLPSDTERSMAYVHVDIRYPIAARNLPMVKMCLDQGLEVSTRFDDGSSLLLKAVEATYESTPYDSIESYIVMLRDGRKLIQLLLEYGADPSKDELSSRHRLIAESRAGRLNKIEYRFDWMIQQLLESDPNAHLHTFLTFTDAVWVGDLSCVENLLTKEPTLCSIMATHNSSPLGVAVLRGDVSMVNFLLDNGFSADARDPTCSTPLAIATACGQEEMVRVLIRRGASLAMLDPVLQLTPLEYAAREGYQSTVLAFIEHGLSKDPNQKRALLAKSLALAVRRHQTDVVSLLLDNGADIFLDMRIIMQATDFSKQSVFTQHKHKHITPRRFLELKWKLVHLDETYHPDVVPLVKLLAEYETKAESRSNTVPDLL